MPDTRLSKVFFAVLLFIAIAPLPACKKSAAPPLSLTKLAGRHTFLERCSTGSYSIYTDSIVVINSSKVYMCRIQDSLYLAGSTDTSYTFKGNSGVSVTYNTKVNTVTFSQYVQVGYGCSGVEIPNLARINPYQVQTNWVSADTGHFGDTIQFSTNAPSNAIINWYSPEISTKASLNFTCTAAGSNYLYSNSAQAIVVVTVSDSSYLLSSNNVGFYLDPQLFAGTKTWTKSRQVYVSGPPTFDTVYNLPDTSFAVTVSHDSIFIWNNFFNPCGTRSPNPSEANFCSFVVYQVYTLSLCSNSSLYCSTFDTEVISGDTTLYDIYTSQ